MLLPLTDCFLSLLPLRRSGLMHVKKLPKHGTRNGFSPGTPVSYSINE